MSFDLHLRNDGQVSVWLGYFESSSHTVKPKETLAQAVGLFRDEEIHPLVAIDLGCGVGTDSCFLLENGWKVIAVDAEEAAQDFFNAKIPESKRSDVTFVVSTFEEYQFPHEVQLINASYSLPYCSPGKFDDVMHRMTSAISVGGRFCGQFFGSNDKMATVNSLVTLDKESLEGYFKDFKIEYFKEDEKPAFTRRHIYHIIAQKHF